MYPIFTEVSRTVSLWWKIYTFTVKKTRYQGVIQAKIDVSILILGFQGLCTQIQELTEKLTEIPITVENMNKTDRKIMMLKKTLKMLSINDRKTLIYQQHICATMFDIWFRRVGCPLSETGIWLSEIWENVSTYFMCIKLEIK